MRSQAAVLSFLAVLVVILAVWFPSQARANDCRPSSSYIWKHNGGTFRKIVGSPTWVEYNANGEPGAKFQQIQEENEQIIILDPERNVQILLRHDLAGIKNADQQQFNQLYQGSFLKTYDCT